MTRHVSLRIATYNIHSCRGMDRRTDPVADRRRHGRASRPTSSRCRRSSGRGRTAWGRPRRLPRTLGMTPVMAPTRLLRGRPYGNAIIGRFPVRGHHRHDVVVARPRAARLPARGPRRWARASCTSTTSTSAPRSSSGATRRPISRGSSTRPTEGEPCMMLGDFNEWLRGRGHARPDRAAAAASTCAALLKRRRTYPGFLPMLHLDHIYYRGEVEIVAARARRGRGCR